ncbi:N-acetyl-gamma-glutamyl-phosphate reductase, partial [Acinetobacter baumannii]
LLGETDIRFSASLDSDVDVIFLCVGHGDALQFLNNNRIPDHIKIIDLSQDFRLQQKSVFGNRSFVYGLPELNRDKIAGASNIANPGCFATAIQLG